MDDVPTVIAGLETLAQRCGASRAPTPADATWLLEEQAGWVDELADRLRAWLLLHVDPERSSEADDSRSG
jgi:hypothetical protein